MSPNSPSGARDVQATEVLANYSLQMGPIRRLKFLAGAGGWSGSLLWRVEAASGQDYCLRRWPAEHPSAERLELIHSILEHVGSHGFEKLPTPIRTASGTFVTHENHLWELALWLRGEAVSGAYPSTERLRAAMRALADFHVAAATFYRSIGFAPTITERLRIFHKLQGGDLHAIETALRRPLDPLLDIRAQPLFEAASSALADDCWNHLAAHARDQLPLQPAIRDIHRDHVLFLGDEVSGIIDFGALRIDTPLADVARLLGSMAGNDAHLRETALDAYSGRRAAREGEAPAEPLSPHERKLINVLDQTVLILSVFSWLRWLYMERRDMGPAEPIARRWDEITARLLH